MNVACIMDPIGSVNYQKDTSYFLLKGAYELGHKIYHIDQNDIYMQQTTVYGFCTPLSLDSEGKLVPKEKIKTQLGDMQLIFVRKDPPFDRRYFYTTLLLDHLPSHTLVSNKPQILRDWNEKLAALEFPEYCPPTLTANSWEAIYEFALEQNSRLVIKPLDGNGGKGIDFVNPGQADFKEVFARATKDFTRKILVQKYVPETKSGDVRVLFVKDKVLGAIIRIAPEGKELNNLDQGAVAHPWQLTTRQREICAHMAPVMFAKGVSFVGIDFLGDTLIEINVTSPTGLQELSRFEKQDYHHEVVSSLLS